MAATDKRKNTDRPLFRQVFQVSPFSIFSCSNANVSSFVQVATAARRAWRLRALRACRDGCTCTSSTSSSTNSSKMKVVFIEVCQNVTFISSLVKQMSQLNLPNRDVQRRRPTSTRGFVWACHVQSPAAWHPAQRR